MMRCCSCFTVFIDTFFLTFFNCPGSLRKCTTKKAVT